MATSAPRAVLLRFDGIVHTSDLPTQAFARHLTERLTAEQIPALIGGMRGFLEGKPELIPPGIDLTGAEDGEQAVEILARAAGLDQSVIEAARTASRFDLAASAWAVDRAEGLDELLAALDDATVTVLTAQDDPAAAALLQSEEITVDTLIQAGFPAALDQLLDSGPGHSPLIVIGTRWSGELSAAHTAGCITVLLDRYGAGRGTPTLRGAQLSELVPPLIGILTTT